MHGRAPHGRVSLGLVRSRALRSVGRAGAQAAPVHGGPLPDGAAGGGGGAAGGVAATARTTWKTRRSAAGGLSELSRPARRRGVLGRLSRRGDGDGRGLGWPDGSAMYHCIYSVLLFLCSRAMMGWDALRYTRPGGWDAGSATASVTRIGWTGVLRGTAWGGAECVTLHPLGWCGMRDALRSVSVTRIGWTGVLRGTAWGGAGCVTLHPLGWCGMRDALRSPSMTRTGEAGPQCGGMGWLAEAYISIRRRSTLR